jgi:hypothetical protein
MTPQELRERGRHARQIVSRTKSQNLEERHRVLRSAVKDLLPNQENIHSAVLEGCVYLLKMEANSGGINSGIAAISALRSQLHRSYNERTLLDAVCFAEGFLGIEESFPSPSSVKALQNPAPIESWGRSVSTFSGTESYSSTSRSEIQEAKMQGPQKLIVAGSLLLATLAIALLGVTTLKVLDANKGADRSNKQELGNASLQENMSTPGSGTENFSTISNAQRQPQSNLEDLGYAVGGQKLQLDLASIKAYPNSAKISFRYALGNENIDSIADCGRREWMTLPERKWHSPQSAATQNMLSRVCEAFRSDAPAISSSGVAIVFDPPSNIRITPNGAILCSITSKGTIPIQGKRGDWYETDYCGSPGYIHKGQVKF